MLAGVTSNFKNLMLSGSGIIKSKLVFDDIEFTDDDIYSIDLKNGSSDGKTIAPGTVYVPELICEITPTDEWLRNKQMSWYVGLSEDGETFEWAKVCTAWVKTIEKSTDKIKITAYSKMYSVNKTYYSELTYPTTTIKILNEIASKINMPIVVSGVEAYTISEQPTGYTYRQVIADIAGLYGCFAVPDRDDSKIMFKWYEDSNLVIEDDYDEPKLEETDVNIGGLACNVNGKWKTSFGNGYVMEWSSRYMTSSILDSLRDKLSITYRVGSFNLLSGNILIDPWDIVTLVYDGTEYKLPAGILEHKYDGGLTTSLQTPGDTDGSTTSSSGSPVSQAMDRLNAQIVQTQLLVADKADIIELAAIKADINKLNTDKASIKELQAVIAEIDSLDVKYASIDLSNIENGTINRAMIAAGAIGTAQIADSSITDAKIVELTANKITAGTLSVERLEIRGSENSIIYAINNITGALQSENADTINGEVMTERSITADKIVAKAITSNEIASRTITANNILSGTITSSEIKAGTIKAVNIASGAITADKINVDSLQAISAKIGGFTIGDTYLANGTDMFGKYEPEIHRERIDVDVSSGRTFSETIDMPYCKLPIKITYSINSSTTNNVSIDAENTEVTVFNVGQVACTAVYSDEVLTLSGGGYGAKISFTVVWYKDLGGSVYLGLDGVSCGANFSVNSDGDLIAASGKIAGFKITDNTLSMKFIPVNNPTYCYLNTDCLAGANQQPAEYSVFMAVNAPFENGVNAKEYTPSLFIAQNGDLVSTYNNDYYDSLRISGAEMYMRNSRYIKSGGYNMIGRNTNNHLIINDENNAPSSINLYVSSNSYVNFYVGETRKAYINSSGLTNSSDEKLKSEIEDIDDKYVQIADKLKPKTYKYNDDKSKTNLGFIAQDLEKIISELGIDSESFAPLGKGDDNEDGYMGINYIQLIPILWAKVQQLSQEIEKLKGEINGN